MKTVPGTTPGSRYRGHLDVFAESPRVPEGAKPRLTDDEVRFEAAKIPRDLWPMLTLMGAKIAFKPRYELGEGEKQVRTSDFEMALPTRHPNQFVYMAIPMGIKTEEQWRAVLSSMADYGYAATEKAL